MAKRYEPADAVSRYRSCPGPVGRGPNLFERLKRLAGIGNRVVVVDAGPTGLEGAVVIPDCNAWLAEELMTRGQFASFLFEMGNPDKLVHLQTQERRMSRRPGVTSEVGNH